MQYIVIFLAVVGTMYLAHDVYRVLDAYITRRWMK